MGEVFDRYTQVVANTFMDMPEMPQIQGPEGQQAIVSATTIFDACKQVVDHLMKEDIDEFEELWREIETERNMDNIEVRFMFDVETMTLQEIKSMLIQYFLNLAAEEDPAVAQREKSNMRTQEQYFKDY